MKSAFPLFLLGLLAFTGCAQLDLTPEGNPDRTLRGTVTSVAPLPAGALVTVRLIDQPAISNGRSKDQPVPGQMPRAASAERVLAEQEIPAGAAARSVAFQLSFRASDAQLRRGFVLEARVASGGRVSHRSLQAQVVTLGNVGSSQEVAVSPLR